MCVGGFNPRQSLYVGFSKNSDFNLLLGSQQNAETKTNNKNEEIWTWKNYECGK